MTLTWTLRDLIAALDDLGWNEHAAFEAEERPDMPDEIDVGANERLRVLAALATPALLDELERQPGYEAWALRLSPLVAGDAPEVRARRHVEDRDPGARYWARDILSRRPDA